MRRRSAQLVLWFLTLCSIVACGDSTPAVIPTSTAQPIAETATPAPSSTPDASPTGEASPTAPATHTAGPTPTSAALLSDPESGAPALTRGSLVRRPFVVMIDNHPNAYPQTGLDQAPLVFEALAEYGITRFMAVYPDSSEVEAIGPVRSARIYYIYWALPFQPVFVHAGGSPEALDFLDATEDLLNLEQLSYEGVYSWRSQQRRAPHNLYTSSELMRTFRQRREQLGGLALTEAGYLFRQPSPAPSQPEVARFDYYFLQPDLPISWHYDAKLNGYLRMQWGKDHIDAASGDQLWVKSVAVIEVAQSRIEGDDKGRIDQEVLGSGTGQLFSEGRVQQISWKKEHANAPLIFFDQSGQEVSFPAGQLWVAVLPNLKTLDYEQS